MMRFSDIKRRGTTRRGAWTLIETLTAVGILITLSSLLLVGARSVQSARSKSRSTQQLAMIAGAIDRYAAFWPAWKAGGVVIAEKGWPDFIPGRIFLAPPFDVITGYNNDIIFDVTDIYYPGTRNVRGLGDVCNANSCLAAALSSETGTGPYLSEAEATGLAQVSKLDPGVGDANYPSKSIAAAGREVFVDPWGTLIRYFWVYRDATSEPSPRAYRGLLPVDYGALVGGAGGGGVDNPLFRQSTFNLAKTAVGYVLESAGPDKKFGNVWKVSPTQQEIQDSEDNVVIVP
jgi:type II secretory pathway pseudopilin PulG